ncbi:hypothetical protein Tco_0064709 [Tanacetum coccineum]
MTKRALLHSWIEVGNNEGIIDADVSSDDDRDQTNSSMITKPELKIGDEFLKILRDNSFNGTRQEHQKWTMEFYVDGRNNGTIDDFDEPCKENCKKTCSDLFFKPYLDAHDGKDNYEIIDRDYSLIPILAHHDIDNPDELCQTKDITVIRYSVGSYEEFITVGPSKISTVKKTPSSMSCIYHKLFNKKIVDGP